MPSIKFEYIALIEIIKLLMSQDMTHYSWQPAFEGLEEKGSVRIITLFKMALKEMPRLERAFINGSADEKKKAREEIIALFSHINIEMQKALEESGLAPDDFTKELRNNRHFTPEEWAQLSRVPELIGEHHKDLYAKKAYSTPSKKNPYFKV